MTNDREPLGRGCRGTIIMAILTLIAIVMLLGIATVAAPLDKLQTSPTITTPR